MYYSSKLINSSNNLEYKEYLNYFMVTIIFPTNNEYNNALNGKFKCEIWSPKGKLNGSRLLMKGENLN